MSQDYDFQTEPVRGLPEALPDGEHILWQGAPQVWALATQAMRLYWVAGWFVLIFAWRTLAGAASVPWAQAARDASFFLALGVMVCVLLFVVALIQAKATVYTITNRRVAMRIGAALTMTLNLPFRKIANANLALARNGTGTITLEMLSGPAQVSYLVLWPHVRPGRIRVPEPALRAIADPKHVAGILSDAAEAALHNPVISSGPAPMAAE